MRLEILKAKNDQSIIGRLALKSNISVEMLNEMMAYNIMAVEQVSEIFNTDSKEISFMFTPMWRNGKLVSRLTRVFPFPCVNKKSFPYVLRDAKFEEYLLNYLK